MELSAVLCAFLLAACLGAEPDGAPAIPGLDPAEEIVLVEVDPLPSDDYFVWLRAYEVEGLPPVNVGHATARFLEDAHRQEGDPASYRCIGDASGSGECVVEDAARPAISGAGLGDPDIRAWSWLFVPDGAVAVRFTDQNGRTRWQRPDKGLVIFPDTVPDDPDGNCACSLEAIDVAGGVLVSVDVATASYVND